MKNFNEAFRTKLYSTIKDIEDNSLIEVVVIIKPQSSNYRDIPIWAGVVTLFLVYSFFMFSPIVFDDVYQIYGFTVLSFPLAFVLVSSIPSLKIKFTSKKRKEKAVEIATRAIFQKGGIRFTNDRIGTLIYCSLLEKKVYILPDRGAKSAVPEEDWIKIENDFQTIFNSPDIGEALLKNLAKCKPIFSEFIPPVENDINELPDDLDINL